GGTHIDHGAVAKLAVAVVAPADDASRRREDTNVRGACADRGGPAGDGGWNRRSRLQGEGELRVAKRAAPVGSPAFHATRRIDRTGAHVTEGHGRVPGRRGDEDGHRRAELRAVAELPGKILAPAKRLPRVDDRAAVREAGRDRDRRVRGGADAEHRKWIRHSDGLAVPELKHLIRAPATH